MDDIDSILDGLTKQAHTDGGWGYRAGQSAHLEPTCLALLALALKRQQYQAAIERGLAFLDTCAGADGAYRLAAGRPEAVWPTALVLFLQATLGLPQERVAKTASTLLALRGQVKEISAEELATVDIDVKLVGWPWAEGTFSWVEPTAWACLALRRAGYGSHPRVAEGEKLLLDRAFDEGGVNYGNRKIFGRMTDPVIGPTAIMLLALQGKGDHPRVSAAATYLQQETANLNDVENLAWAKLALSLYRDAESLRGLDEQIRKARESQAGATWVKPSPLREALAALALSAAEGEAPAEPRTIGGVRLGRSLALPDQLFRLAEANGNVPRPPEVFLPKPPRPGWGERIKTAWQGLMIQAAGNMRQVAPPSAVHISKVASYESDLADVLKRQYESFRAKVPLAGKRVVLKPNLVEYRPNKVINTHPNVIAAAIELCQREGAAEVIVAEGPGHWRNVQHVVSASGLGDVLRHHGVSFVDLNHDDPVQVVNLGRTTGLQHLYFAQTIHNADVVISLAKLKTHHWAGATLSLKNMFGTLPGICYGWPKNELHWRGIPQSIIDIALTRAADLAIIDGIIGMEGDGPLNGTPKPLGALVMGADPVAVDATCCRLMKLNPEKVGYLVLGQQRKLGLLRESAIQQIGEAIEALAQPFETVALFHQLYMGRSA